ncbi:11792_t:CDS:2 [Acaulospora morrowiae]|uniref:11792_t:CDS:1 n=1 Tax=Acaulospora morrowiae TaxID=94023 RepID=A0A9N9BP96_9GLOM|nr:11792_t:CDS:2 [Acaulospora morrowiae]
MLIITEFIVAISAGILSVSITAPIVIYHAVRKNLEQKYVSIVSAIFEFFPPLEKPMIKYTTNPSNCMLILKFVINKKNTYKSPIVTIPPTKESKQSNVMGGNHQMFDESDIKFEDFKDNTNLIFINSSNISITRKKFGNNDNLVDDQKLNAESYKDYYYHHNDYDYEGKIMNGENINKNTSSQRPRSILIIQMEGYDELTRI